MTASSTDSSSAAPIGRNLKEFHSVVVLTGAGISAESGVKTFRDNNGLWENHRMEEIATPEGFAANPELVQAFYNARRAQLRQVAPNPAHWALAAFERSFKGNFLLITQNVDDLHGRAGSRNLLHMHGELRKVRCVESHQVFDWAHDIQASDECACCGLSETLRPHIVWFGEMPLFMDEIYRALEECDLFLSIGTSGHVYPAAGFVQVANQSGAHTVEINLEPSQVQGDFGECIYGPASRAVPDFLSSISSVKD